MRYKLAIFDLDGTILDTLEDLANSTNYALKIHGFPERTIDEVRRFVGNGIGNLIKRAVPSYTSPEETENVLKAFSKHYKQHCADNTSPYKGIIEMLTGLKEDGMKLAVVSNKADFAVQELVRQYFPDMFNYAVGERQGIRRKPCPDSVNEVLTFLNTDKKDAVYIGDSDVDIETAANADMDIVSVTWGFRDVEFLKAHGAVKLVDTPKELSGFLKLR